MRPPPGPSATSALDGQDIEIAFPHRNLGANFVYWCRPPLEEINNFEQNAPVEDDALPPVLDVEATPTSPTCHRHLTQSEAIADMQVMLQEMERHYRKRPIIYTTVDFYEAILSDGAFMDYPIWVRSTKHHPAVRYGSRAWHFWQYQSDGRVPGIVGHVDKDAFYGTKEQWDAFLSEPGRAPCRLAPPSPRPPLRPRRRRLRSRRSLSPSPPAPSGIRRHPGGVGNLHHRPRFELQHPEPTLRAVADRAVELAFGGVRYFWLQPPELEVALFPERPSAAFPTDMLQGTLDDVELKGGNSCV